MSISKRVTGDKFGMRTFFSVYCRYRYMLYARTIYVRWVFMFMVAL